MKYAPFGPVPWDLIVFLTITMTGLGISVNRLSTLDRFTASVQASDLPSDSVVNTALSVVDLGCIDQRGKSLRYTSEAGNIRFKGKFCGLGRKEMRSFGGIRVKNLSSGDDSTVFLQGVSGSFVTDAVGLQSGKNVIQFLWKDAEASPSKSMLAEVFEK